jgi:hypothetical protein
MTSESMREDPEVSEALQDLFQDRFDGVDWARLNERIVAEGVRWSMAPRGPAEVLAGWSRRAAVPAGGLIAAGVAALLLFSDGAEADSAPPGFWPVAEELLAGLPADTRRLLNAGSEAQELLQLIAIDVREGVNR